VRRGRLDEVEQFRIACVFFTNSAGGRHIMNNPLMSNQVLRRIVRGKNLMHVTLVSPVPAEEPDAAFTVIFINGEQLVVRGFTASRCAFCACRSPKRLRCRRICTPA
jgi:hypothetical protein